MDKLFVNQPCKNIRVLFGGTFDPVHLGHIAIVSHLVQQLQPLTHHAKVQISVLPTAGSPLKQTSTEGQHRLDMLNLAIQNHSKSLNLSIDVDDYEIHQPPPIYTFNTLSHFQMTYPNDKLIFVLGMDSLLQLHLWYRGHQLLDLASFWVLPRHVVSMTQMDHAIHHLSATVYVRLTDFLTADTHGIYVDDVVVPNLASRQIRQWLSQNDPLTHSAAKQAVLPAVWDYIQQHQLYVG